MWCWCIFNSRGNGANTSSNGSRKRRHEATFEGPRKTSRIDPDENCRKTPEKFIGLPGVKYSPISPATDNTNQDNAHSKNKKGKLDLSFYFCKTHRHYHHHLMAHVTNSHRHDFRRLGFVVTFASSLRLGWHSLVHPCKLKLADICLEE